MNRRKQDGHYHEITLDDGQVLTTGPEILPPDMGEEAVAADAASADAPPPLPPSKRLLTKEREYIRDESGRFATEGVAGAANDAIRASDRVAAVYRSTASAGGPDDQDKTQVAAELEEAAQSAAFAEGDDSPEAQELAELSQRAVRARSSSDMRAIAAEARGVSERLVDKARSAGRGEPDLLVPDRTVGRTDTTDRKPGRPRRTGPQVPANVRDAYRGEPDLIMRGRRVGPGGVMKSESQELAQAQAAIGARSLDHLPAYGREVYDRMYSSTFAMFGKAKDPGSEAYATAVAWRAVGQAYGLDRSVPRSPVAAVAKAAPRAWPTAQAKYVPGGPVHTQGAFYVVQITSSRGAEKFYDRIEDRPIPDSGGAIVRIGIGRPKNHHNVIDVRVPKRVVDSTPGGSGPRAWVNNNWDFIRSIAKSDIAPGALFRHSVVKRDGRALHVTGCKFVSTPEEATDRITYDVVYAPWEVDLQGQYATEAEVRKMAHEYQGGTNLMHIDGMVMSDGQPAGRPVESFIARAGDPDFPRGSWVMGVKWHPEAWKEIVAGNITGYSIEGMWGVQPLHRIPEMA